MGLCPENYWALIETPLVALEAAVLIETPSVARQLSVPPKAFQ
jgi:hypothetical protein